jgi:hypothetical protein
MGQSHPMERKIFSEYPIGNPMGRRFLQNFVFITKNLVVFILVVSLANPNNLTNILSSLFFYTATDRTF